MYAIARRSSTNPNVLRFVMDPSRPVGNSTASIQTYTSREKARTALKARVRDGYFIVPLTVPATKKAKASK